MENRQLLLRRALLPEGWASDVVVSLDEAGTIVHVGATDSGDSPPAGGAAEVIDGHIVAGVPNLHSHAHQRLLAGLTEYSTGATDSFWTWRELMYRAASQLGPDEFEVVCCQLYAELLAAGFTHVCEFQYLHHQPGGMPFEHRSEMTERALRAATRTGIGITLLPVLYCQGGFGGQVPSPGQARFVNSPEEFGQILEELASSVRHAPLANVGMAPHSIRAVDPKSLRESLALFGQICPGGPVHIHIAEQRKEVTDCLEHHGARPVEWLLGEAPVGPSWCLIHATHSTEIELAAMARSGAVAGLCPTTEANLGDGLFDVARFTEAGGVLGVGTDSHVGTDPAHELRWLEYGARLATGERNVLSNQRHRSSGRALLELAWQGGARAAAAPVGRIEPGHRCDLVALSEDHPALLGARDDAVLDSWIFAAGIPPVSKVLVAGRTVARGGRHVAEEGIGEAYREVASRLRRQLREGTA